MWWPLLFWYIFIYHHIVEQYCILVCIIFVMTSLVNLILCFHLVNWLRSNFSQTSFMWVSVLPRLHYYQLKHSPNILCEGAHNLHSEPTVRLVRLTIHVHLVPKFRKNGTLPPSCLYPFMMCTRTTLLLP